MQQPASRNAPRRQIGVVASFDFTREEELRRWLPPAVECTLTFTDKVAHRDNLELVSRLAQPSLMAQPVQQLVDGGAEAVAYLCTACSFADGVAGERALREAMTRSGAPRALTTSSAVVDALHAVGARRLAVVHPYQPPVGDLLSSYLQASGFAIDSLVSLGLAALAETYTVDEQRVFDTVAGADHPDTDAMFISCTALPTYAILHRLEERLGKPVISANQATMWALLHCVDEPAHGPGQQLLRHVPLPHSTGFRGL